jgi:hypothetical protein
METTGGLLHRYGQACTTLLREYQVLQADLNAVLRDKIEHHFAIDFSEIFAFAKPEETYHELALLPSTQTRNRVFVSPEFEIAGRQRYQVLLHRLFFDSEVERLFLLAPYALETDGFIHREKRDTVATANDLLPRALKQVARLEESAHWPDIQKAAKTIGNGEPLGEGQQQAVLEFLEQNASALLTITSEAGVTPLGRLKDLFASERIQPLTQLVDVPQSFDLQGALDAFPQIVKWKERLHSETSPKRRKSDPSAARLDALAVAITHHANRSLAAERKKLLLVSRSRALYYALQEPALKRGNGPGSTSYLRNPRQAVALYGLIQIAKRDGHEAAQRELDRMVEPLSRSVAFIDLALVKDRMPQDVEENLRDLLASVEEQWIRSSQFEGLLDRAQAIPTQANVGAGLLQLIANSSDLRHAVLARVQELRLQIERAHQALGSFLHRVGGRPVDDLRLPIWTAPVKDRMAIGGSSAHMPYSVNISSVELIDPIRRMESSCTLESLLELARDILSRPSSARCHAEALLLIALSFGLRGEWKYAHTYSVLALEDSRRYGLDTLVECLYFTAVCRRKPPFGELEDCLEAMHLLSAALNSSASTYRDPRILKELASIAAGFSRLDTEHRVRLPRLTEPTALLEESLAAGPDDRLRAHIHCERIMTQLDAELVDRTLVSSSLDDLDAVMLAAGLNADPFIGIVRDIARFRASSERNRRALISVRVAIRRLRHSKELDALERAFLDRELKLLITAKL